MLHSLLNMPKKHILWCPKLSGWNLLWCCERTNCTVMRNALKQNSEAQSLILVRVFRSLDPIHPSSLGVGCTIWHCHHQDYAYKCLHVLEDLQWNNWTSWQKLRSVSMHILICLPVLRRVLVFMLIWLPCSNCL